MAAFGATRNATDWATIRDTTRATGRAVNDATTRDLVHRAVKEGLGE